MWRVLTDEDLRTSLIEKGLKRAKKFSWERAAQETLDVYHRVGK
jgi:glycosyltransferase involved in cell wall biosynthesis